MIKMYCDLCGEIMVEEMGYGIRISENTTENLVNEFDLHIGCFELFKN